ncbi:acyl-CoA dehydrogenase family protein [Streptomyces sp. NPDC091280]|uniref:acyl-CoA dehydrogenase family protein n=1 Tax=Streptomyces sp. NPDC091280 TaxID=3365984 RepID=UPI00382F03A5
MSTRSAAERIGRTEELLPVIAARAAKAEELRRVPEETVRDLIDAGLIRVANPTRYGGYGLDIDTSFEIGWRLGRVCGATA